MKKSVQVGDIQIGGGAPVSIQSMCNTRTSDVDASIAQIRRLEEAGCEIIRLTVPDMESAEAFGQIKRKAHIPVVADIHFDYRLAIAAIDAGADKIRINNGLFRFILQFSLCLLIYYKTRKSLFCIMK